MINWTKIITGSIEHRTLNIEHWSSSSALEPARTTSREGQQVHVAGQADAWRGLWGQRLLGEPTPCKANLRARAGARRTPRRRTGRIVKADVDTFTEAPGCATKPSASLLSYLFWRLLFHNWIRSNILESGHLFSMGKENVPHLELFLMEFIIIRIMTTVSTTRSVCAISSLLLCYILVCWCCFVKTVQNSR